jgi:type I restriction enzyme S subunit
MLSDKNFRLRFDASPVLQPELLAWMCNTRPLREQISQFVSGAEGLAKNIGSSSLRELWLPVPPTNLQADILSGLTTRRDELGALDSHLVEHIARLREYRSSLISAAVTGQLDAKAFQEAA